MRDNSSLRLGKSEILLGLCLILLIALFIRSEKARHDNEQLVGEVALYSDSVRSLRGLNDAQIAVNSALTLSNEKQLRDVIAKYDTLAEEIRHYKSVNSTTVVRTEFSVRNDTLRYETVIPCDFTPFKVTRDCTAYFIEATVSRDYLAIDSVGIPNRQDIVVGIRKRGFLRRPEASVSVINSNPLIATRTAEAYTVNVKPKWYQTRVFAFAVGVALPVVVWGSIRR